jgi:hypothetical protein
VGAEPARNIRYRSDPAPRGDQIRLVRRCHRAPRDAAGGVNESPFYLDSAVAGAMIAL